jgi:Mg2+/Co2+ transporter CorC
MFFHTPRIYKNVVNEYHDKLVQLWHEDRVHEIHEVCQCIRQSEGHDKIFKETISCCEGCLRYIFSTNLDLMITRAEINLREHLSSC